MRGILMASIPHISGFVKKIFLYCYLVKADIVKPENETFDFPYRLSRKGGWGNRLMSNAALDALRVFDQQP